jgi:hypothetical protein
VFSCNNLYYLKANNKILILALYADDLFNIGDYCHILSWLKTQLTQKYEMNNLGDVSKYFAFEIEQSWMSIFNHQTLYCFNILKNSPCWIITLYKSLKWNHQIANIETILVDPTNYIQIHSREVPISYQNALKYMLCDHFSE